MNTLQQANAGREGAEIGKHFGFLALFGLIVSGLHVFLWAWIGAKQVRILFSSFLLKTFIAFIRLLIFMSHLGLHRLQH